MIHSSWYKSVISRKTALKTITLAWLFTLGFSCTFVQKEADQQFSDQHFKTAIAHIELYKIRYGTYPQSLHRLTYLGAWDEAIKGSVEYRLLDKGYELNVKSGVFGGTIPRLNYPADFWNGLGLRKSNVKQK